MAAVSGQVRIIGGVLKRTPVRVGALRPGLRPTPDRVRETVFNWIGAAIEGAACLDLFAGSGALGLEAASRGAGSVCLNDRDPVNVRLIRELVARLTASTDEATRRAGASIELQSCDALQWLRRCAAHQRRFDWLFLDPPFDTDLLASALPLADAVLSPTAGIYVESRAALDAGWLATLGWAITRQGRAGQVHYHLLGRATEQAAHPAIDAEPQ